MGVPYSPIVPSFRRWASGASACIAPRMLKVFVMLLICTHFAWGRSIIE